MKRCKKRETVITLSELKCIFFNTSDISSNGGGSSAPTFTNTDWCQLLAHAKDDFARRSWGLWEKTKTATHHSDCPGNWKAQDPSLPLYSSRHRIQFLFFLTLLCIWLFNIYTSLSVFFVHKILNTFRFLPRKLRSVAQIRILLEHWGSPFQEHLLILAEVNLCAPVASPFCSNTDGAQNQQKPPSNIQTGVSSSSRTYNLSNSG